MPSPRRRAKVRRDDLTFAQFTELAIGPSSEPMFADDAARRAAWSAHRDELLAVSAPGTRPWAFWRFEAPDGVFDRGLVVEGESALDVTQLLRDFSHIDLHILEVLPGLRCRVAGFLAVANDVLDGSAGLLDLAIAVELVSIAKLMPCDLDAEFGAVFGMRAFEA